MPLAQVFKGRGGVERENARASGSRRSVGSRVRSRAERGRRAVAAFEIPQERGAGLFLRASIKLDGQWHRCVGGPRQRAKMLPRASGHGTVRTSPRWISASRRLASSIHARSTWSAGSPTLSRRRSASSARSSSGSCRASSSRREAWPDMEVSLPDARDGAVALLRPVCPSRSAAKGELRRSIIV